MMLECSRGLPQTARPRTSKRSYWVRTPSSNPLVLYTPSSAQHPIFFTHSLSPLSPTHLSSSLYSRPVVPSSFHVLSHSVTFFSHFLFLSPFIHPNLQLSMITLIIPQPCEARLIEGAVFPGTPNTVRSRALFPSSSVRPPQCLID